MPASCPPMHMPMPMPMARTIGGARLAMRRLLLQVACRCRNPRLSKFNQVVRAS